MSRTDVIADAFTIIRNAIRTGKEFAIIPHSDILMKICEILEKGNYIENFKEVELGKFKKLKVYLKYDGKKSMIRHLRKISVPGRRVYAKSKKIRPVLRGYGIAMISTPCGLMTDSEARQKGLGGEIIGLVW